MEFEQVLPLAKAKWPEVSDKTVILPIKCGSVIIPIVRKVGWLDPNEASLEEWVEQSEQEMLGQLKIDVEPVCDGLEMGYAGPPHDVLAVRFVDGKGEKGDG